MKVCTRCRLDLDESQFRERTENRKSKGGPFVYLNNTCKKCDSELSNKYYFRHKDDPGFLEKWRAKSAEYVKRNHERVLAKLRDRNTKREHKEYMKKYRMDNKQRISENHKKVADRWRKIQVERITDVYCIGLIRSQNGGKEKCPVITQEMIEQKRLQIQIKRKLYEINKQFNTCRSDGRINSVFQGTNIH